MKIHEYQAKEILRRYGVATPRGQGDGRAPTRRRGSRGAGRPRASSRRRSTPAAAARAAASSSPSRPTEARDDRRARSSACSSSRHQTGPEGQLVRKVLDRGGRSTSPRSSTSAIALDRAHGQAGRHGVRRGRHGHRGGRGEGPRRRSHRQPIDPALGLQPFQARAARLRARPHGRRRRRKAAKLITALVDAFVDDRRLARRDQSAGRHRATATCSRSTPR